MEIFACHPSNVVLVEQIIQCPWMAAFMRTDFSVGTQEPDGIL